MTSEEFQIIVRFLEQTPERVKQLTDGLATESLTWKASEKEWSILEHVCHLRDIDQEERLKKLINESRPFLRDLNGEKLAVEREYNKQNFERALAEFSAARRAGIRAVKSQPLEKLHRVGSFENVGTLTLEGLLLRMCEHDREHLEILKGLREKIQHRK